MTIKELKIELEKYPEDTLVKLYDGEYGDYYCSESVKPIYEGDNTGKLLFIGID